MRTAAHRGNPLLNIARVGQQADAVAGEKATCPSAKAAFTAWSSLLRPATLVRIETAGVEHDPDGLTSFRARTGGLPVSRVAQSQSSRYRRMSSPSRYSRRLSKARPAPRIRLKRFSRRGLAAANQIHRVPLGFVQIGINRELSAVNPRPPSVRRCGRLPRNANKPGSRLRFPACAARSSTRLPLHSQALDQNLKLRR